MRPIFNFLASPPFTLLRSAAIVFIGLMTWTGAAQAQSYTYALGGTFVNSDWNADGTNAVRTPGGPFSGSFTIDTDTLSVTALEIDTTFYSIFSGNQVVTSGTYNFGVGGTDDEMGTASGRSIRIGKISASLLIGLTTILDGTASYDGRTGSIIQIMDQRLTASRIYRPRLTIFMENVDFTNADGGAVPGELVEQVYNINRGNGVAGFSGAQGSTSFTAVPEPSATAAVLGAAVLVLAALRRSRSDRLEA